MEASLKAAFEKGEFEGLHSVLVYHKDEVFAEAHFPGKDESWGRSLGTIQPYGGSLHDLRSVTKSIASLVYGIALAEGVVPGLNESLLEQFPKYPDLAADPQRRKITIRHTLSMKMGTEWNEDLPYTDVRNSEIAMERAPDRYRYVLDRPMVNVPGDRWTYNGGATALIGHLIAKGTGRTIDKYAREKLFDPLGISDFQWMRGSDGVPSPASGLRLNAYGLARIGRLVLNRGKWKGQQIVPAGWLDQSFTPHATLRTGTRYGLFWWLAPNGTPPDWVAGFGNGGQRLMIIPSLDLVVVVFAGNYNQPDAWRLSYRVTTEFVVPAVRKPGE